MINVEHVLCGILIILAVITIGITIYRITIIYSAYKNLKEVKERIKRKYYQYLKEYENIEENDIILFRTIEEELISKKIIEKWRLHYKYI